MFNGGGFTYDATTHLPTGGGIASIQLVDNSTGDNTAGHVLETITNVGLQLGDLGNFIAREEAIRAKVPWAGLIETGDNGPLSFSGTKKFFLPTAMAPSPRSSATILCSWGSRN